VPRDDDRKILRPSRGALSNPSGRFEVEKHTHFDDGWDLSEELPELVTTVAEETARTIITSNQSPDVPFQRSINPYRGCEHGCIYCFARPSHAYLGLSPGKDFETRLFAKKNATELLREEWTSPRYQCNPIVIGANTDPYQPIERQRRLTRSLLELFAECRHPVSLITKSSGVLRDLDVLADLARDNLCSVYISLTTLDAALARRLEPRAAAPLARLRAMKELAAAQVPVGALISPIIPGLTDHSVESLVDAAADAGVSSAGYILLRLPHELRELFEEWLEAHVPDRRARVLQRIRDTRGGKLNDPRFGHRMKGSGPYAEIIARRFEVSARRRGLSSRIPPLCTELFAKPAPRGQLSLF
jgi:DNA repair photolyase